LPRPRAQVTVGCSARSAGGTNSTRLYTRTGDGGETGLAGGGRIDKDSTRIATFGAFDELGAALGVARAHLPAESSDVQQLLIRLQHELFVAQSEVASPPTAKPPAHRIEMRHVTALEQEIDRWTERLDPLHAFVLPGGSLAGSHLHVARTAARRAERSLWKLHRESPQRPQLLMWTNRLSDLLFAVALAQNRAEGILELPPNYTV
jgi:cob(I)alamin adenosyltransferase